jgi:amino acid transporter
MSAILSMTFLALIVILSIGAAYSKHKRKRREQGPKNRSTDEIKAQRIAAIFIASCLIFLAVFYISLTPSQNRMYARQDQAKVIAQKASEKITECEALGDRPFRLHGKVLVRGVDGLRENASAPDWSMPGDNAIDMFDTSGSRKEEYDGPVTVFLVSAHKVQVGVYSVSKQPAYRQWADVYVVQFQNQTDSGTAIAAHSISSVDPQKARPVQDWSPGFGNVGAPLQAWIHSLLGKKDRFVR